MAGETAKRMAKVNCASDTDHFFYYSRCNTQSYRVYRNYVSGTSHKRHVIAVKPITARKVVRKAGHALTELTLAKWMRTLIADCALNVSGVVYIKMSQFIAGHLGQSWVLEI